MAVLHIRNSSGEFEEVRTLNGKTAYQAAKEGGYTGTESEFNTKLAQPEYSLPTATDAAKSTASFIACLTAFGSFL